MTRCYRTLPSATCDNYFIVKFLLKSNVTRVILLTNCIKLVKYNLMPTWYRKARAKSASTNFTWLYFVFPNSFWGGSRTAATSKMERFAIIVNGFQPLAIITKRSISDDAAVPDPSLSFVFSNFNLNILYFVYLFGIRWSFAIDLFSNIFFQTLDYFWKHVPT